MKSKTKIVALVMSMLICISMIGVGFAAWVIVSQLDATASGKVNAEAVTEGYVVMSAEANGSIFFGAPSSQESGNNVWLKDDNGTEQSLTATLTLKVKGNVGSITVDFATKLAGEATNSQSANFDQAVSDGYITGPSYGEISVDGTENLVVTISGRKLQFNYNSEGAKDSFNFEKETTITIKVSFGWGSKFGNKNPFEYYNDGTKTATSHGDEALAALKALYNDLGADVGLTYTFTFTAVQAQ